MRFYYDPFTEFNRLFDDAFTARFRPSTTTTEVGGASNGAVACAGSFRPRMDLHEAKDSNTVTATFELPGMKSEDVTIDVHQGRLTVFGNASSSHSQEEAGYAVRERHYGKFTRTLQLPIGTKPEDVKAKMENGVLIVTFPKVNAEQQPHRIAIQ
ncbi:small heat shock protein [Melanogaster broomeanus]|nr:small heat shock protein [Melanogaster broomeanus]